MKSFKKLAAAGICAVMASGICTPAAFAAEKQTAAVQLNGKTLESTQAVLDYDHSYLPYDVLLKGLNADAQYDKAGKTVTASHGDTKVVFTVGSKEISVSEGGETITVVAPCAPYEADGTVYLPLRDAAQALGCYVGWDDYAKTAILIDADCLLGDTSKDYTLMDKYIKYSKDFSAEYPVITGKINMSAEMNDDGEKLVINGVCDLTAVTTAENMAVNTDIKLDMDSLIKSIEAAAEINDEEKEMLDSLKEFTLDFYFDMKTGKFYVASDIFPLILGASENTWILFDLNTIMSLSGMDGFNFSSLMDMAKSDSFSVYADTIIDFTGALSDTYMAEAAAESLILVRELFSDEALVAEGNNYTSKYVLAEDGITSTIGMTINTDGTNITGYEIGMDVSSLNAINMNMDVSLLGTQCKLNVAADMAGFLNMNIDGNLEYQKTTDKVMTVPTEESKLVSFEEIFM